jgi:hypothetical protein
MLSTLGEDSLSLLFLQLPLCFLYFLLSLANLFIHVFKEIFKQY